MLFPGNVCFYLDGSQIKSATIKSLSIDSAIIVDEEGIERVVSADDFKIHFHEKEMDLWISKRERLIENNRLQKQAFRSELALCDEKLTSLRKPRKPRVVKEGAAKPGRKPKVAVPA